MLGVFTAEEMRRLDRRAIAELGIPGATLMENAGRGAAEAIVAALPALGAPRRGARVVDRVRQGRQRRRRLRRRALAQAPGRRAVRPARAPPDRGRRRRRGSSCEALRPAGIRPLRHSRTTGRSPPCSARAHVVVDALLGTGLAGRARRRGRARDRADQRQRPARRRARHSLGAARRRRRARRGRRSRAA